MLLCGNEKKNASTNAFLIFCSGTALTEQSAALLSCFRQTQWYPVLLVFLLQRLPHLPHIIIFENGDSSPAARINGFLADADILRRVFRLGRCFTGASLFCRQRNEKAALVFSHLGGYVLFSFHYADIQCAGPYTVTVLPRPDRALKLYRPIGIDLVYTDYRIETFLSRDIRHLCHC